MIVLPDGSLASAGSWEDKTIRIWNTTTGKTMKILTGHNGSIYCLAVLSDYLLASGGGWRDKTIRIWNTTTGTTIKILTGHTGGVLSLVVLKNGLLASGSQDTTTIRIWNITTGQTLKILNGHKSAISTLIVLPDGTLASGGEFDATIRIWNMTTSETIKIISTGHIGSIRSLAISSDHSLISAGNDMPYPFVDWNKNQTIQIWNTTTGKLIKVLTGHTGGVRSLLVLPDGLLASGGWDRTIRIRNITDERTIKTLTGHNSMCLVILNNGSLASSSAEEILIWNYRN